MRKDNGREPVVPIAAMESYELTLPFGSCVYLDESGVFRVKVPTREAMAEIYKNVEFQFHKKPFVAPTPLESDPVRPIWMEDGILFGWKDGKKVRVAVRGKSLEILEEIVTSKVTPRNLLDKFWKRNVYEKEATLKNVYDAIAYLNKHLQSFECEASVNDSGVYEIYSLN